jgi:hypothetical protein
MPKVVQPFHSIQYDGTNAEHIAGTWCTSITLVSDTGTTMVFADGDNGTHHTVELNEWLVAYNPTDINPTIFTAAAYADRYYELP